MFHCVTFPRPIKSSNHKAGSGVMMRDAEQGPKGSFRHAGQQVLGSCCAKCIYCKMLSALMDAALMERTGFHEVLSTLCIYIDMHTYTSRHAHMYTHTCTCMLDMHTCMQQQFLRKASGVSNATRTHNQGSSHSEMGGAHMLFCSVRTVT